MGTVKFWALQIINIRRQCRCENVYEKNSTSLLRHGACPPEKEEEDVNKPFTSKPSCETSQANTIKPEWRFQMDHAKYMADLYSMLLSVANGSPQSLDE